MKKAGKIQSVGNGSLNLVPSLGVAGSKRPRRKALRAILTTIFILAIAGWLLSGIGKAITPGAPVIGVAIIGLLAIRGIFKILKTIIVTLLLIIITCLIFF